MVKVLVNATPLLAPLTGIGQYIRHLFTAMDKMQLAELSMLYGSRIEKGFRLPSPEGSAAPHKLKRLAKRFIPFSQTARRLAAHPLLHFRSTGSIKNTLYHEPNYLPMPFKGPLVLTLCDMSCFDHPETHPAERVRLMQHHLPAAIERASHLIVISDDSRRALQRWFNVADERITTTYLAADERFRPHSELELKGALNELGLAPQAYVLCVGTLEPRKNLSTLFAAYAGLPSELRKRFPLVVAGMSGWNTDQLMSDAGRLMREGDLRFLGYVKDELVPSLYAGAAAFCYPSRYEGFGLPALEAMASGVPVLTTNRTSLPEVVGPAGLMVDPDDVGAMRDSLRALLEDKALANRLAGMGLERAATFSWERCARETASVYERIALAEGLTRRH